MNIVIISREFCKGCGLCTRICPPRVLVMSDSFNARGYYPAEVANPKACIGCGFCAQLCPDVAIAVYREDD
ncbi:MAG TPA: 4Fe-4S dicluster domain-containing protein [Atribacteraceae bacterium]|nr:4Fe-4S dicluster domain-containing protein [Atribacteraceae bacterium]